MKWIGYNQRDKAFAISLEKHRAPEAASELTASESISSCFFYQPEICNQFPKTFNLYLRDFMYSMIWFISSSVRGTSGGGILPGSNPSTICLSGFRIESIR